MFWHASIGSSVSSRSASPSIHSNSSNPTSMIRSTSVSTTFSSSAASSRHDSEHCGPDGKKSPMYQEHDWVRVRAPLPEARGFRWFLGWISHIGLTAMGPTYIVYYNNGRDCSEFAPHRGNLTAPVQGTVKSRPEAKPRSGGDWL
ncbi:hypothetical protein FISHEDRAFT_71484 [Fistulina hepatica ATCC 64428]|uniref:Uncharacterized protein n=1 Tax=Fistulina hepatica ATCC 64428 TaxID=1128425 RepID=A0A0D7AHV7_9AGAR|nr:hypothetical protein FISHEDRAFT_71484 [Fistulina hepatica ATCC 64428]